MFVHLLLPPPLPPQDLPQRPRRNRRSETVRKAIRETWLGPEHFIMLIFVQEETANNQPIASMPGQSAEAW